MSDVFLSYARDDRPIAEKIANAIQQKSSYSVWWDVRIDVGKEFDRVIEAQIKAAHCVVVLWSSTSVNSHWVRTEADYARSKNKLLPIRIDNVEIPFAFRLIQTLDILGVRGQINTHQVKSLIRGIEETIHRGTQGEAQIRSGNGSLENRTLPPGTRQQEFTTTRLGGAEEKFHASLNAADTFFKRPIVMIVITIIGLIVAYLGMSGR